MKISKRDALLWFRFFAELPEGEQLSPRQTELREAVLTQIEDAADARCDALRREIPGLRSLDGRTFFVGPEDRFPRGCRSCLTGTGLTAIRRTNRCNLRCPFCYDYGVWDEQPPIGEGYWEIGGSRYRASDVPLLLRVSRRPTGVSYVYLEPFMEIERYEEIIRAFHEGGVHQHMYTNGTLCTEENLRMLGEAGLDELRFNLGASGTADRVIDSIALAKRFIPRVGIETPMTPEFYAQFHEKKDRILRSGADFMNCAELHLTPNNAVNYEGEPLYMARRGYISPVWSHELTLRLMREAAEEGWPLLVHDCCNRTKLARDLHLRAQEGGWFGASSYGCEFGEIPYSLFLPVLEDESFRFVEEEELPPGYRVGDIVI